MRKNNKLIMIAHNNELQLIVYGRKEPDGRVIGTIPIQEEYSQDELSGNIPEESKKIKNPLLVMPDYVVGIETYPFATGKKSIASAFIRRKLSESFPSVSEITDFYSYTYSKNDQQAGSIYAFCLQDPLFFNLYNHLKDADMRPDYITTPAFIWQHKLGKLVDDSSAENFCLIHVLPDESYLYFFANGNFIFSRSIMLPGSGETGSGKLDVLAFEISQSLRLFSQKAKSEVNKFFFVSSTQIKETELSDRLGKDIVRIEIDSKEGLEAKKEDFMPAPLSAFSLSDIDHKMVPTISHRLVVMEKAWHSVTRAGIITGALLVFLLGFESFYLNFLSGSYSKSQMAALSNSMMTNRQVIEKHNETIDLITNEMQRPDPASILGGIALSLPGSVAMEELTFNLESPFQAIISGRVKTNNPGGIKPDLSAMVEGLTRNLKLSKPAVIGDIGFDMEQGGGDLGSAGYKFHIQLDLK
ncbi:MAG: hypothetical protein FP814_07170 [Desulfobacterium sp.]|nr:hypothetical protein [Desulfobacterium sp.]